MSVDAGGLTRRRFIETASVGLGVGLAGSHVRGASGPTGGVPKTQRLPREVWIASLSLNGLRAEDPKEMTRKVLARMEEVVPFEPDIVCLPEVFPFANLTGPEPSLAESSEEPIGPFSRPFAQFAEKHKCHVICPIHTVAGGRYYNAAVFIDRNGQYAGQYQKMVTVRRST